MPDDVASPSLKVSAAALRAQAAKAATMRAQPPEWIGGQAERLGITTADVRRALYHGWQPDEIESALDGDEITSDFEDDDTDDGDA